MSSIWLLSEGTVNSSRHLISTFGTQWMKTNATMIHKSRQRKGQKPPPEHRTVCQRHEGNTVVKEKYRCQEFCLLLPCLGHMSAFTTTSVRLLRLEPSASKTKHKGTEKACLEILLKRGTNHCSSLMYQFWHDQY